MNSNHSKFLKHLDNSSEAVFIVAKYLYLKGLDVRINALKKAKKHSDWKKYKDDGDLFIFNKNKSYRIEVKGLSCDFTNKNDWSFKDFIVCAKHSFDNSNPKPYAYFILNKKRTHCAIVKEKTSGIWNIVQRKDNRYQNIVQEFYTCDLSKIEWISFS
jgi:hypothetical protein|tara:strand:+ start:56 stop:529 length:474 start_codon:yes stop_codon:yes gene_type:complete